MYDLFCESAFALLAIMLSAPRNAADLLAALTPIDFDMEWCDFAADDTGTGGFEDFGSADFEFAGFGNDSAFEFGWATDLFAELGLPLRENLKFYTATLFYPNVLYNNIQMR